MLKILSWEDVRVGLERMLKEEETVYTKAPGLLTLACSEFETMASKSESWWGLPSGSD